jgi:hypothetical protein
LYVAKCKPLAARRGAIIEQGYRVRVSLARSPDIVTALLATQGATHKNSQLKKNCAHT